MNRRTFLQTAAGALLAATAPALSRASSANGLAAVFGPTHPLQAVWQSWKALCLLPEGRIVDGPQAASSHSEGQAYALTLAVAFDDVAAFDLIMGWTEANLAVRPDALLAWRWKPGQAVPVEDMNNASDGDLFYAWALSSMAARHHRPELATRAAAIVRDLVAICVVAHPDPSRGLLFLPGAVGFVTDAGFIINPSYYMPRAMRDLAEATGTPVLAQVARDGHALIADMAATGMVPDWAEVTARGWQLPPARFSGNAGYESVRVSLFAAWSGDSASAAIARHVAASAMTDPAMPGTVFDRLTGMPIEVSADPGYRAVAAFIACAASGGVGSSIPPFSTTQPYYPATLHLLAFVAQAEVYPQCVPL